MKIGTEATPEPSNPNQPRGTTQANEGPTGTKPEEERGAPTGRPTVHLRDPSPPQKREEMK